MGRTEAIRREERIYMTQRGARLMTVGSQDGIHQWTWASTLDSEPETSHTIPQRGVRPKIPWIIALVTDCPEDIFISFLLYDTNVVSVAEARIAWH